MRRCSQCGYENTVDDKFCANCGTPLTENESVDSSTNTSDSRPESKEEWTLPPPAAPTGSTPSGYSGAAPKSSDEWTMSSLGPPPAKKRRLWLWIVLGILGACLLIFVGFIILISTDSGGDWFSDFATEAAERATEAAGD